MPENCDGLDAPVTFAPAAMPAASQGNGASSAEACDGESSSLGSSLSLPLHLMDATMFWSGSAGGVRRYLEAKHDWMDDHTDWRHTIATPHLDHYSRLRVPSLPLPGSGGYRLPVWRAGAARRLAAARPDLIEVGDPYGMAWAALEAAQHLGIPTLAFCHSNLELLGADWGSHAGGRLGARAAARLAVRYATRVYREFDLVLAPSEAMRRRLIDWGVEHVATQSLGVDTQVFHPMYAAGAVRDALALPLGARLLIYAGRFAPEKNLGVLSAAVRRLGDPYWLVAVGSGPAPPHGDRVIVLRHVDCVHVLASLVASADAFVHAGEQETFGLAVLEALACGTPVVARPVEGLGELVDDRVGMAVTDGRPASFAEAIAALFQRDRVPISTAARARAVQHDWNRALPALWRHYARLLHRTARPEPPPLTLAAPGTAG